MPYLPLLLLSCLVLTISACAPRYKGPITDHFNGKKFFNPGMPERTSGGVLKWLLHRDKGPWPEQPDAFIGARPATRIEGDSLVLTFVNHSTFLIQTNGLNILTDPVWSDYVGLPVFNIKRKRPPGLRFDELPPIDVVLLSHNHYDHLDLPTIRKLVKAHNPLFVTPLGVSHLPKSVGGRTTRELDWNDTLTVNDKLWLTCTQAQHFSNRGLGDRDETLWCGYLLHTSFGTTYFCGDSGYGPHFKHIGEVTERDSVTGPIKLALLPIGSYRPEWFMAPVHVSPAGSVQAFLDLNAKQAVGIHFGTFQQGDDGLFEPAVDLRKALQDKNIPEEQFLVPKEGHPLVFN